MGTKRPFKALFITPKTKKGTRVVTFKSATTLRKGITKRRRK